MLFRSESRVRAQGRNKKLHEHVRPALIASSRHCSCPPWSPVCDVFLSPQVVHTLYAFQDCPVIDEIVVVAREDLVVDVGRLCREFNLDKVRKVIVGGQERIHSVQAGLREVDPEADLIAIHDGARPLVPQEIIRDTVARAALTGAAAPAIPLTDTVKRTEDGLVVAHNMYSLISGY